MKDWFVVVNRSAGRSAVSPDDVKSALDSSGVSAEMETPGTPEAMAQRLIHAAKLGYQQFCVVGGDGTVNLAINTLLTTDLGFTPTLGVLPAGTGCDLLRTFAIPQSIGEAANHLKGDLTYDIDVVALTGEWGLRYFSNVGQAGVGAAAAQTAPKLPRRLGAVRYPIAFAARLPRFPTANIRLETPRRTIESEALAVIFANAQYFAGGWNVAPRATLMDGVLDVQIINARKTQAPALVPKVIRGTHLRDPSVRRISVESFSLMTDPTWPVEVDGDPIGNTNVEGKVVRAAIRLKI